MKTTARPAQHRDERGIREGYLLLADISGYTEFLTGTELQHAHEIIRELTTLIRERLAPPMSFVKLEGDAIFCYADSGVFRDGERLVELIEACYCAFSDRLLDMSRATTCRCRACAAIDSLGLKFIAHHGNYVIEHVGGSEDLTGADVILAHRLLKNSISKAGGPEAYAFFTQACLARIPATFRLPEHVETYESFGETKGGVHDLEPVLAAMREERHLYISSEDADFEATFDLPVPPPVAWQYVVDPIERQRWACGHYDKNPDREEPNAQGRLGPGAKSHCGHGPGPLMAFREFIDWRPFSYFSARTKTPAAGGFVTTQPVIETIEFTPLGEHGTRIAVRYREVNRNGILRLLSRAIHPFLSAFWRRRGAELVRIIKEDAARFA